MRERTIGDLIYRSRMERNITQKQLCEGICSVQTLSKIESGERMPDVFLLEYLLQRLGLSPDDLEIVLFEDELRMIELKDTVEEKIENGELEDVVQLIEVLKQNTNDIKLQYYHQVKAVLACEEGCYAEAIEHIEIALRYTETTSIYSTREIQLLCMMSQMYLQVGQLGKAKRILEEVVLYLEQNTILEKELVKTYPKAIVMLAELLEDKRERIEHVNRCERAFELLINWDSLVFLPEVMNLLIQYYTEMRLSNKALRLQKQLQSLEELAHDFGWNLYMKQKSLGWFEECSRRQYLLCEEMIRGEREAQRIRRGELVEGIYEDLETLARIETGTQSPSYKKYVQLMERLNGPTQKYIGPPLWDEDLILHSKEKITKSLIKHEYEDAREEIEKLKLLVEEADSYNQQYIARQEVYLDYKTNQIDAITFMNRIKEVLEMTYPRRKETLVRIPTLDEFYVLNYLSQAYRKCDMKEEGVELYRKLLECYDNSKLRGKYHYGSLSILYRNYLTLLEELNCSMDALDLAKQAMCFELDARRGKGLDYICTEIMCIYEKMDIESEDKKKQVEKYLRLAFYISDLFVRKNNNKVIDNYYKSHIDADVEWYQ